MKHVARTERSPEYLLPPDPSADARYAEDQAIEQALRILRRRLQPSRVMESPNAVKQFFTVHAGQPSRDPLREYFTVMYLDSQHQVLDVVDEFVGTLTQTSVYPREIARAALTKGAAAVVLSHNHPSGRADPSRADEKLTHTLKDALALVDVRVLDHIITAGDQATSMAELGLV